MSDAGPGEAPEPRPSDERQDVGDPIAALEAPSPALAHAQGIGEVAEVQPGPDAAHIVDSDIDDRDGNGTVASTPVLTQKACSPEIKEVEPCVACGER